MSLLSIRRLAICAASGLLACILFLAPCVAQQNTQPTPQQIEQTVQQLLAANPNGGARLSREIRNLILSDHAALAVIMNMLASANPQQQSAIGTGLGLAAQALVKTDQAFAAQIQQALAASGIQPAITAYTAVTPNSTTTATGAGGGGSGGPTGGGAPGGGAGGGGAGFGSNNFANTTGSLLPSSPTSSSLTSSTSSF